MNEEHLLVSLARRAIEEYVRYKRVLAPPLKESMTPEMERRGGVFVSLKKKRELRGCIGTFLPTTENVACEVIRNAISAATEDPRFPPVKAEELDELDISVDILSKPEFVSDLSQLDPKRYGVIVESGWRRGLLLPDLEGVDTVEQQLSIAMAKAGIKPKEQMKIYRFQVERFK